MFFRRFINRFRYFFSAGASVYAYDLEDQLLFESDVTTTSEDQSQLRLLLSDVEKYIDFNGDKFLMLRMLLPTM